MKNHTPTVIVSNFAEAHVDFLGRCADPAERSALILSEAYHADRTLLWAGDPKLVIVSYPIAHENLIVNNLRFSGTKHIYPQNPSYLLSQDVVRETRLIQEMVAFAGVEKKIDIIPYATTKEFLHLVDVLREQYGLIVQTPESPEKKAFWLRDYIDTKNGFRSLASMWLKDAEEVLPLGFSCYSMDHALKVADWFSQRGEACVLKADTGESGIGTFVLHPDASEEQKQEDIKTLREDPYFANELIVVEKFVPSARQISPSLEIMVPKLGEGSPKVTYLSGQLFLKFGDFCGIQVDKSLYETAWYPQLEQDGLLLAGKLQMLGYVGHFDLDCIVSDEGHLYLLEINARRTGGTHVHDFASHYLGEDYLNKASFISYEAMDSGKITDPNELQKALADFLLPIQGDEKYGVVITITRALHLHRFGCICVAPTSEMALKLQQDVQTYLKNR